ncbi:hypothetical protein ACLESD_51525 [Pyxidicoccus sp. 3LFB2]
MRPDDLLTRAPSPEAVARETRKLPQPTEEAREALRRSLEAAASPPTPAPWPALLQEARGKMDSRYAEPATSHRGGLAGLALVVSKRAFRRVFQPFINEALRKQVEFNESILDALATLHDVQREHSRTQATWRQEMDRRLARIEAAAERAAARGRDDAPAPGNSRTGGEATRPSREATERLAAARPSRAASKRATPEAAAPSREATKSTVPNAAKAATPSLAEESRAGNAPHTPAPESTGGGTPRALSPDPTRGGASRGRSKRR